MLSRPIQSPVHLTTDKGSPICFFCVWRPASTLNTENLQFFRSNPDNPDNANRFIIFVYDDSSHRSDGDLGRFRTSTASLCALRLMGVGHMPVDGVGNIAVLLEGR